MNRRAMNRRHIPVRDRGATLPMFAICLTVLMAMSAMAVDLGLLFSERRDAQTAADTGALGGALDLANGMDTASEATAALIRSNLSTPYSDAEWISLWTSCTDADHLLFTGEVLGNSTQCISFDGLGVYRVVVPQQEVETAFASVLGIESFSAGAFAEVELTINGVGGVLPFAVLATAPTGSNICMRSSTNGTAVPPCTGSASGNFGALEVAQWGNPAYGTENITCNLNKTDQLTVNLSVGLDHFIRPYAGTEVIDTCAKPFGPNTLSTFQGISGGLWEGMVEGDTVQGTYFPGRLTRGTGPTQTLRQQGNLYYVDDTPLWEYIPYGKGVTVPATCTRESFDATVAGSGYAAAETQMETCFADFQAGVGFVPLFDIDANGDNEPDITGSARYGAVPQFWESSFPSGNSGNLHIQSFRAVFLNGMFFGCNGSGCSTVYTPGSASGTLTLPNGSSPLDQVSGYLLPNSTLPPELLENGVLGSLGAFQIRLSR
ncbi:MAG: hypothetical protein DHS20C19_02330 [Acidimicrobiales bacterium]|nr:MAG: hypothetical protein DHS20C19_02330 [Acidimicrobiales bacterium]